MRSLHKLPAKIVQQAELSILKHSYARIFVSVVAGLFCATIVFIGLYGKSNQFLLNTWYLSFLAITLVRIFFKIGFDFSRATEESYALWKNLFVIGAVVSGMSWGALGIFLLPITNSAQQILCILILAGVTAGSVSSLSGVLIAVISFLVLALIPYIILVAFSHIFIYQLFDLALSVYLIYMILLSINTHSVIKEIIYLQFENVALVEKLKHLATHDPLLHIDNSRLFYINMTNAIKRADRNHQPLALLFIDLDNFKQVNDIYGHSCGDEFLLKAVERIKKCLRVTDLIARVGGDEFTVILENCGSREAVAEIAKKICHTISVPAITIDQAIVPITGSIGISIYPDDGNNTKTLISIADKAMYRAKNTGGDKFCFTESAKF